MIITTTMHIENKPVQEYKGIVFGEVVEGRNFVKDFMSGIRRHRWWPQTVAMKIP